MSISLQNYPFNVFNENCILFRNHIKGFCKFNYVVNLAIRSFSKAIKVFPRILANYKPELFEKYWLGNPTYFRYFSNSVSISLPHPFHAAIAIAKYPTESVALFGWNLRLNKNEFQILSRTVLKPIIFHAVEQKKTAVVTVRKYNF